MPSDRLLRRAVLALGQQTGPPYQPGSLLMDTPLPLPELIMWTAEDGHETADPSPAYRKAPKGRKLQASSSRSLKTWFHA